MRTLKNGRVERNNCGGGVLYGRRAETCFWYQCHMKNPGVMPYIKSPPQLHMAQVHTQR